jgi:hypothetical protein
VLDRASTFADPEIIKLLQTRFVPVAIDQAYQRRQQDAEGEFYRKIAGQGPRNNFKGTTQGLYVATADGKFLAFNNNRGPERVMRVLKKALAEFRPSDTAAIERGKLDARYSPSPPKGGLVVRVRAKVLGGYEDTDDPWKRIFQTAISRDNLWISKSEHEALTRGELPKSLQVRIARFHLVDNTRGEPPMWQESEIRGLDMSLKDGKLRGTANLKTASGKRGFDAQLFGVVQSKAGKITRFDLVAKGQFWGSGTYTGGAPKGKFPLAVSFTLADGSDTADKIPPQGSRGWVRGYVR